MNAYTTPEWSRSALLTIDVQEDFAVPGSSAFISGTAEIVPTLQRLVASYREAKLPVIHVVRLYTEDGANVDLCRRQKIQEGTKIVIPKTKGSQIVNDLLLCSSLSLDTEILLSGKLQTIGRREWIMHKPRWGAFYKTPLEGHLRRQGISTVVFSGCNFPNCPRTSTYEASERDFRIALVTDAISGIYARGVDELVNIGVTCLTADNMIKNLESL
ncbi:MAG: cysteine hydrolase family protein [Desulfomonilaceae bacterium]